MKGLHSCMSVKEKEISSEDGAVESTYGKTDQPRILTGNVPCSPIQGTLVKFWYTPVYHNIKTTCLILFLPFATHKVWVHQEMDTGFWGCPIMSGTRMLVVSLICRLMGGGSVDQACPRTSRDTWSVWGMGNFGSPINSLGHLFYVFQIVPKQFLWCGLSCWGWLLPLREFLTRSNV